MRVAEIASACDRVTDMARARAFVEGVLGLEHRMAMIFDGDGDTICIHQRRKSG